MDILKGTLPDPYHFNTFGPDKLSDFPYLSFTLASDITLQCLTVDRSFVLPSVYPSLTKQCITFRLL